VNLTVALLISNFFQILEVHMNLLSQIDAPFVLSHSLNELASLPRGPRLPKSDRVPWINTEIIITERHAMKTYRGIVTDVLCNQATPSGLRVVVQLTSYDPTSPFRLTLDYDGVVEARHGIFSLGALLSLILSHKNCTKIV